MKKKSIILALIISLGVILPILGWGSVIDVSSNPSGEDKDSLIGIDSLGNSYVVWEGCEEEGCDESEIYWAKITLLGSVTKIKITDNSVDDKSPSLEVDASGNSYIAWNSEVSEGKYEVYWIKIDYSGTTVLGTLNLSNTATLNEWAPDIGIDASGNSYVVWHGSDSNDYEIYWRKVDSSGALTPTGAPLTVTNNSTPDEWPYISVNSSGNSFVVWTNDYGDNEEIYWARIDTSGTSVVTQQITSNGFPDRHPQIGSDSSGNSYITWMWDSDFSGWDEIYWAKVDSSGTSVTTRNVSYNSENDDASQIAVDLSGTSYIVWEFHGPANEIYWAKVSSSGDVGARQNISNNGYDSFSPRIALDSSGNSYVVWVARLEDGEDDQSEIFWAKVTSSGIVVSEQNISNNSLLEDTSPQIAVDACGASYVTWYNESFEEGDMEVYFNSNPCETIAQNLPRQQVPSILPLTSTHISQTGDLLTQADSLLSEAKTRNLDTSACEKLIDQATELIMEAKAHLKNPIYANNLALQALGKLGEAIDCLKALLG